MTYKKGSTGCRARSSQDAFIVYITCTGNFSENLYNLCWSNMGGKNRKKENDMNDLKSKLSK